MLSIYSYNLISSRLVQIKHLTLIFLLIPFSMKYFLWLKYFGHKQHSCIFIVMLFPRIPLWYINLAFNYYRFTLSIFCTVRGIYWDQLVFTEIRSGRILRANKKGNLANINETDGVYTNRMDAMYSTIFKIYKWNCFVFLCLSINCLVVL